jgi:HK97 family phage prohead protease
MNDFTFFVPFEKSVSDKGELMLFGGIASSNALDRDGDRMTKSALQKVATTLEDKPVFFNHDTKGLAVGKVAKTEFRDGRVYITAVPTKADAMKDVVMQIGEGLLKSFSIGGRIIKHDTVYDDTLGKNVREISDVDCYEVSVVGVPANPEASITSYVAKAFQGGLVTEEIKKEGPAGEAPIVSKCMHKMVKCASCGEEMEHKGVETALGPGELSGKAAEILNTPEFKKVLSDYDGKIEKVVKDAEAKEVEMKKQLASAEDKFVKSDESLKAANARIDALHKALDEKSIAKGLVGAELAKEEKQVETPKEFSVFKQ